MKSSSFLGSLFRISLFTVLQGLSIAMITILMIDIDSLTLQSLFSGWDTKDLVMILFWSIAIPLFPILFGAITCEISGRLLSKNTAIKIFATIGLVCATLVLVFLGNPVKFLLSPVYLGITSLSLMVWVLLSKFIFSDIVWTSK